MEKESKKDNELSEEKDSTTYLAGQETVVIPKKPPLKGLGGWLILVGLGLVVAPIRTVFDLVPRIVSLFFEGAWELLTTPGSQLYHIFWAPLVITEIIIAFGLALTYFYMWILFFKKKKEFPKWYIVIFSFSLIWIFADTLAYKIMWPSESIFDSETVGLFINIVWSSTIWIPYMFYSERVKNTFVH